MNKFSLTPKEKRTLLNLARESILNHLSNRHFEIKEIKGNLAQPAAAFVTLHKNNLLRGCIGILTSEKPLYLTVQEMAISAATGDPRFPTVTLEELNEIEIEISVLSPLKEIKDPEEIILGIHGLYITKGLNRGVLLPQVATENKWDKETFLSYTCLKAGLQKDEWKKKDVKIQIFSAQVFSEKDYS